MIEIKFRAWQKYHNKMVRVTGLGFDNNGFISSISTFVENQAPQSITYTNQLGRFFLSDDRGCVLELMQCTGLKDNSKWEQLTDSEKQSWLNLGYTEKEWQGWEIYEGDIVKFSCNDGFTFSDDVLTIIKESRYHCGLVCSYVKTEIEMRIFGIEGYKYEVIGNIYENPELLKEVNQWIGESS